MPKIENCRLTFKCANDWELLQQDPTDKNRRFCNGCHRFVFLCQTRDDLLTHIEAGDCVAVRRTDCDTTDDQDEFWVGTAASDELGYLGQKE